MRSFLHEWRDGGFSLTSESPEAQHFGRGMVQHRGGPAESKMQRVEDPHPKPALRYSPRSPTLAKMISVRTKLFALVLASFLPAVVGAIVSQRAAEQGLLEEAGSRIKQVGEEFDELTVEYQKSARTALTFATESAWFTGALEKRDTERTLRFAERLSKAYPHRAVLIADSEGLPVTTLAPQKGGAAVVSERGSEMAEFLRGDLNFALVPVVTEEKGGKRGQGYAFLAGTPVFHENKRVGSVAIFSFVSDRYVEYLKRNLGADLALSVDGKVLASTAAHPAPHLRTTTQEVVFKEDEKHLFAVETFRPKDLQRPKFTVELTASRDVSALRAAVRAGLYRQLQALGVATFLLLGFALLFATRFSRSVTNIASAARSVKEGKYVKAPVIHTGDEIEGLTHDFNEMVKGLEERDRLKETFGRYMTRQIADHLMKSEQGLGGELVPVTVLFSDIRSFTSISENMDPRELLDFLNEYLSGMVESVLQHHGVVDKFIGDAIMAVFGAPVPEPEDPLHAVCAALAMRETLAKINEGFLARGLPEIRTGIGLHSGQVVAGNMGHSERMEYTVIGDTVNLASRLEGLTKELGCDIVVSEDLYVQVKSDVVVEPLRKIKVKGRDQEVMVYRLIGLSKDVTPNLP
jgi:adenylate cyclase